MWKMECFLDLQVKWEQLISQLGVYRLSIRHFLPHPTLPLYLCFICTQICAMPEFLQNALVQAALPNGKELSKGFTRGVCERSSMAYSMIGSGSEISVAFIAVFQLMRDHYFVFQKPVLSHALTSGHKYFKNLPW